MIKTDVDIDVQDRDKVLEKLKHIPASIIQNGEIKKHNTGVYFTDIPTHPFTNLANIKIKREIIKKPRVCDHILYISNLSKFKKHYPKWKQIYNTKKIIEELISNY